MTCAEVEELLHAHFDGELPVPQALGTERHLDECAACRARYQSLEWLRSEIRTAGVEYAPPAAVIAKARRIGGRNAGRVRWWWGAAALPVAAALVLFTVGPRLRPPSNSGEMVDAHLRSLAAANLVDVPSSDRHTVKPWFQGKLGFAPAVPDLSADGFVLVGGRVEVIRQRRAAALVYKRREHIINVFIGAEGGAEGESETAGYHVICWRDRGISSCAVSDVDARELARFAGLLRAHL